MPGPRYVKDFEFPASAGFTRSGSDRVAVTPHTRAAPQRFAKGGQVRRALKPSVGQVVGGTLAAGAGLAAMSKLRQGGRELTPTERRAIDEENRGKSSTIDIVRGKTRRQQMEDLGLKKGGKVKKYAGGGRVNGASTVGRAVPTTDADKDTGGKTPLRTGFKKGGKAKRAIGGPVKY